MPRLEDIPPEVVAETVARAVADAVAGGGDAEAIVARALTRTKADLGLSAGSSGGGNRGPVATVLPAGPPPAVASPGPQLAMPVAPASNPARVVNPGGRVILTEDDVRAAARAGQVEIRVPRGTLVTALARDLSADSGVRIVEEG